jgi:UDP-N-acetylglucosamine 2-epimerase (non-hydrolysing)
MVAGLLLQFIARPIIAGCGLEANYSIFSLALAMLGLAVISASLGLYQEATRYITFFRGIQVEATVLGIPCLTVLDSPVWTITHEQGTNILVDRNSQKLIAEALKILDAQSPITSHHSPKCPVLWDGRAAERIVEILTKKRYN